MSSEVLSPPRVTEALIMIDSHPSSYLRHRQSSLARLDPPLPRPKVEIHPSDDEGQLMSTPRADRMELVRKNKRHV